MPTCLRAGGLRCNAPLTCGTYRCPRQALPRPADPTTPTVRPIATPPNTVTD